ncbi:MAG: outer membrane protein assembly factor BamD, partial [Alphaproteobacteria bacterium]|nr:outer membrane protein assembly factor BamD [Alphaproteobacteria bacterium]
MCVKQWQRWLGVAAISVAIAGCAGEDREDSGPEFKSAEEGYNMAMDAMQGRSYKKAILHFEDVERLFPYSPWATRATLMTAYANYKIGEYEIAMAVLERFVRLHPGNELAPYAYYLLAICSYEQITDVGRDQKVTEQAQIALTEVVKRFPNTSYARDAKLKLDLVDDHLAGKEMTIGRYYLKRQDYLAAINRFKYVVNNYQTTSHTAEALHRLVEANLALGLRDEAQRNAAVLGGNFPASEWYRRSFALMQDLPPREKRPLPIPTVEKKPEAEPVPVPPVSG